MNLLKVFLVSVLVLLAVVVAVKVTHDRRVQRQRQVTLPNGTRIQFLGTAEGGAAFTTEKPWERTLRRYLPARMTRWMPQPVSAACGSGSNTLTIYIRATLPSGWQPGKREWDYYSASDSRGLYYQRDGGYCSFGGISNSVIYGLNLRAFPRRQASFDFNFLTRLGLHYTNLGTIRVPNPFRGPFPSWNPESLPQSRSNGPVTLTLTRLEIRGTEPRRYYRPVWELKSNHPAWADSRARYTQMSDATGNQGEWLSRDEPAWKLHALVYRERPEAFRPDEQLIVTNLPLPGPAKFEVVDQAALCNRVSLRVRVLSGPGCLYLTNGVSWFMEPNVKNDNGSGTTSDSKTTVQRWASIKHFLLVEALGPQEHDEVQLQITDQDGRDLKVSYNGWHGSGNGSRSYRYEFTPAPESTTLTVTTRLSRPLAFEFLVDPKTVVDK